MAHTLLKRGMALVALLAAMACSEAEGIDAKAQGNTDLGTAQAMKLYITIDGQTQAATFADTRAAQELQAKLQDGPVDVTLNSSGGFEIWGVLGFSLTSSDERISAGPGDIILYDDSNICLLYGTNTWSYTRLGKLDGLSQSQLRDFLKAGETGIKVRLSLQSDATGIKSLKAKKDAEEQVFNLRGQQMEQTRSGIFVSKGRKVANNRQRIK